MSQLEPALVVRADLPPADHAALVRAIGRLRASRGLVIRGSDLLTASVGGLAASSLGRLRIPDRIGRQVRAFAMVALSRGLDLALVGRRHTTRLADPGLGRAIALTSGAVAGFAGLAGFLPDATATTFLILRAIADIAESEGEDLDDPSTRQACLEVLAFASPGFADPDAETGDAAYWSARLVLHGKPLSLLLSEVAASYGLRLSQRLLATAVPLLGAVAGALVNATFLDHYRAIARTHFTIRRLERSHGATLVRAAAAAIAAAR